MWAVTCSALVVVGAACQADGDELAGDTPIQEPTSVTEPSSESDDEGSASIPGPESTAPTDPTTSPTEPPAPTLPTTSSSDVIGTNAPERTAAPTVGATETVYEVGMIDAGLAPFTTMATADLADRLGVEPDAIEVLTAVLVTWPNSALGCPEPGRAYAQVATDGSVIELGVDGLVYRYHTGGSATPFPCDRPLNPVPTPL